MSPAWLILGVVVAAFIALGLVGAFVFDRRRNEEVAHDTERVDPTADRRDHTPPADTTDPAAPGPDHSPDHGPDHDRLHVDPQFRGRPTDG